MNQLVTEVALVKLENLGDIWLRNLRNNDYYFYFL